MGEGIRIRGAGLRPARAVATGVACDILGGMAVAALLTALVSLAAKGHAQPACPPGIVPGGWDVSGQWVSGDHAGDVYNLHQGTPDAHGMTVHGTFTTSAADPVAVAGYVEGDTVELVVYAWGELWKRESLTLAARGKTMSGTFTTYNAPHPEDAVPSWYRAVGTGATSLCP